MRRATGTTAMKSPLKIAHIRAQETDLIIVPISADFRHKPAMEQHRIVVALPGHFKAAGMKGEVNSVWDAGEGRMAFVAPQRWKAFLSGINLDHVHASINTEVHVPGL